MKWINRVCVSREGFTYFLFSVGLFLLPLNSAHAADQLEELIEQIRQTPFTGDKGINERGQHLSEKVAKFGPRATPLLLPLLQSDNENVRDLAGYTLIYVPDGIRDKDLDVLIAASRDRSTWLPCAIAQIGTPKAIRFLAEELRRDKSTETQWTGAFDCVLGEKGVPYLVQLYREGTFDSRLTYTLNFVFKALRDRAEVGIDPLVVIAKDEAIPAENRRAAVLALGKIGPKARRVIPAIHQLALKNPTLFKEAEESAIADMGVPESVEVFVQQLQKTSNPNCIRDIAELKENGRGAGPALRRYLIGNDWALRVAAARAMGYIGYTDSIPDLIKLLDNPDDWRSAWASAESLGRLHAKEALPTLKKVAQTHWYPFVQKAAAHASEVIINEGKYQDLDKRFGPFAVEFYQYESSRYEDNIDYNKQIKEAKREMQNRGVANEEIADLEKFKEVWYKHYYIDGKGRTQRPKNSDAMPDTKAEVEGGYLIGSDHGEWGGDLFFVAYDGSEQRVVEDNIEGIHVMKSGVIVVTGLAHLGYNSGTLYKAQKDEQGKWYLREWRALPDAPYQSAMLKDGRLMVICRSGSVVVSPDGQISWLNLVSQNKSR